jgi:hypothetical protein
MNIGAPFNHGHSFPVQQFALLDASLARLPTTSGLLTPLLLLILADGAPGFTLIRRLLF